MAKSQRILFVTDYAPDKFSRSALEQQGFEVSFEAETTRAYTKLLETAFDLLIIDLADPQSAVNLLKEVRGTTKLARALVLTIAEWGSGQPTLALSHGADAFEPRPIDAARLVSVVEQLLRPRMVKTAKATAANGEADADE